MGVRVPQPHPSTESDDLVETSLTDAERRVVRTLVRAEIRRAAKQYEKGLAKWGDEYDSTVNAHRTAILVRAYEALGGSRDLL